VTACGVGAELDADADAEDEDVEDTLADSDEALYLFLSPPLSRSAEAGLGRGGMGLPMYRERGPRKEKSSRLESVYIADGRGARNNRKPTLDEHQIAINGAPSLRVQHES
jgi:hypothetical protein